MAPEAARGVRAAKQQRSQAKHEALLAAGRSLLKTHDLPSLSVAQVAAAAGVAVGSFYSRFEDKNAWFGELCRQAGGAALAELQALLASAAMREADAPAKVALLMAWLTQVHREHQGIYRAAVSDPARTHLYWGPLMRLCDQVVALVFEQLAPHLDALDPPLPPALRRRRVEFAFQVVFSTLVNAVLHDGGWVRLDDPALEHELARVFLAAVGVVPAGSRPGRKQAQGAARQGLSAKAGAAKTSVAKAGVAKAGVAKDAAPKASGPKAGAPKGASLRRSARG